MLTRVQKEIVTSLSRGSRLVFDYGSPGTSWELQEKRRSNHYDGSKWFTVRRVPRRTVDAIVGIRGMVSTTDEAGLETVTYEPPADKEYSVVAISGETSEFRVVIARSAEEAVQEFCRGGFWAGTEFRVFEAPCYAGVRVSDLTGELIESNIEP